MTQGSLGQETIKVAEYLFTRLRQLGVQCVFGVPGDYNLRLLDFVEPAGLHWVGNCNELNAAYAADGYARINGLGALITTFGVGELSAVNGIAGAYAEKAPVIHIVGTPNRELQESRALVHHTFADGEYGRFAAMHKHVTIAQTNLWDPRTAPEQIDYVLEQALVHSRPVYLQIPNDMVDVSISAANLSSKKIAVPPAPRPEGVFSSALSKAIERICSAKRPLILVDGECRPLNILDQVDSFVKITSWPTWVTTFGKGLINEQLPNVYGLYAANFGDEQSKAYFDSSDLVVHLGPHISSTNTQAFTTLPNEKVTISLLPTSVKIGNEVYRDISSRDFLEELLRTLDHGRIPKVPGPPRPSTALGHIDPSGPIIQDKFYRFINPLLRAGDIVLTETGTASHGGRAFVLPPNTRLFAAITWLSIGYMLPAALGAALAQREQHSPSSSANPSTTTAPRTILLIGDGSFQMTAQELSTIIRERLDVLVLLLNNRGYTIERAIHGRAQPYNDIAPWRHRHALRFFGADEHHARQNAFEARTWAELDAVMRSEQVSAGTGVRFIEVFMEQEDCTGILKHLMETQKAKEGKA